MSVNIRRFVLSGKQTFNRKHDRNFTSQTREKVAFLRNCLNRQLYKFLRTINFRFLGNLASKTWPTIYFLFKAFYLLKQTFICEMLTKTFTLTTASCPLAQNLKLSWLFSSAPLFLLNKGGFRLKKWLTNNKSVLAKIPESERFQSLQKFDFNNTSNDCVLGIM